MRTITPDAQETAFTGGAMIDEGRNHVGCFDRFLGRLMSNQPCGRVNVATVSRQPNGIEVNLGQ